MVIQSRLSLQPLRNSAATAVRFAHVVAHLDTTVGHCPVSVVYQPQTEIKADAYVVPQFQTNGQYAQIYQPGEKANHHRMNIFGIPGWEIYRHGGRKGMEAFIPIMQSTTKPVLGSVYLAESGGGNAPYLLHSVYIGCRPHGAADTVRQTFYNALNTAYNHGLHSVVAPPMGTSRMSGLTNTTSAKAMLTAIEQFAQAGKQMDVKIAIQTGPDSDHAYLDFIRVFQKYAEFQPIAAFR